MNELKPLLDLLGGHFGFLPTVLTWLAAIKLAMTFVEIRFTHWASDKLNEIASSADEGDDEYLRTIFSARSYRLGSFVLRLLGLRLPTLADLERAIRLQHEAAIDAGGNLRSEVRSQRSDSALRPPPSDLRPLLCLLASLCLLSPGCGTLDKSGIYQGDQLLYQSELTIVTSYEVIHAYVSWEQQNAAALKHLPQIKQSADFMRRHSQQWISSAHALHDAYKADPSNANKKALVAILDILRAAMAEAAGYMGAAATAPRPPPS